MSRREVVEGIQYQGEDESISYRLTTTRWASDPTNPIIVVKENDVEVTETVMPVNSPTVSGDVITLSPLQNLTAGNEYRVEVKFQTGVNTWEPFFRVIGEE